MINATGFQKNATIAKKGWILDNGATPTKKVDMTGGVVSLCQSLVNTLSRTIDVAFYRALTEIGASSRRRIALMRTMVSRCESVRSCFAAYN